MGSKNLSNKFKLFLTGLKEGFYLFGETVSGLTNTILLFMVYLLVFAPISVIGKILGKEFLPKNNGWQDVKREDKDNFYRQF